jgi:hypothetical protein
MHGRGRYEVGALERVAGGCRHPVREDRQPIPPPTTLQIEDEPACVVVIGERCARGVVGWFTPSAGAAHRGLAHLFRQGEATTPAERRAEEMQFAPKFRFDHAGAVDKLVREERARRPDEVR